jgi:hypothetical protein
MASLIVCCWLGDTQATDILVNKKERRLGTINRNFIGDYIGLNDQPALRALLNKREVPPEPQPILSSCANLDAFSLLQI